eukprot:scaffold17307_cov119-Isochrysis_galbana.AAC.2
MPRLPSALGLGGAKRTPSRTTATGTGTGTPSKTPAAPNKTAKGRLGGAPGGGSRLLYSSHSHIAIFARTIGAGLRWQRPPRRVQLAQNTGRAIPNANEPQSAQISARPTTAPSGRMTQLVLGSNCNAASCSAGTIPGRANQKRLVNSARTTPASAAACSAALAACIAVRRSKKPCLTGHHVFVQSICQPKLDGFPAHEDRAVEESLSALAPGLVVPRLARIGCSLGVLEPVAPARRHFGLEILVDLLQQPSRLLDRHRIPRLKGRVAIFRRPNGQCAVFQAPLLEELDDAKIVRLDADRADYRGRDHVDLVAGGCDVIPARGTHLGTIAEKFDLGMLRCGGKRE